MDEKLESSKGFAIAIFGRFLTLNSHKSYHFSLKYICLTPSLTIQMTNHFDALFEKDVMIGVKADAKFREHIIIQEEIALTSGTNF